MVKPREILLYIFKTLIKPFKENLGLFLLVFYCSTAAILFFERIYHNPLNVSIYMAKLAFVISYSSVFAVSFFSGKTFRILRNILIAMAFLNLTIDAVVELTSGSRFDDSILDLICQTNRSEIGEYFSSYFSSRVVLSILAFILIPAVIMPIWKYVEGYLQRIAPYLAVPVLIYSVAFTKLSSLVTPSISFAKISYAFSPIEHKDLAQQRHNPQIVLSDDSGVSNIIVILGESLSKSHCSLYSYEKETYPLVNELKPTLFQMATSPAKTTNAAFRYILNTSSKSETSGEWYAYTDVFDLADALSYKTHWISNQARYGMAGNIAADYASLADNSKWLCNLNSNESQENIIHYDGVVLAHLDEFTEERNLAFLHLMGSHEKFSSRYPAEFEYFHPEDYDYLPSHQRKTVAQYDNSLRYNDYVVSEIIKKYDTGNDLIVFYFPDHALDIYESNDSFCGHGLTNSPESIEYATSIPFMMYYSEQCAQLHPEIINSLCSKKDQQFCTDSFIYLLAEAMGISILDGVETRNGSK